MATMTQEQIDQKMQQLKQLAEEAEALTKELMEAGAIEIPEEDLDKVAGGYFAWQQRPVPKPGGPEPTGYHPK